MTHLKLLVVLGVAFAACGAEGVKVRDKSESFLRSSQTSYSSSPRVSGGSSSPSAPSADASPVEQGGDSPPPYRVATPAPTTTTTISTAPTTTTTTTSRPGTSVEIGSFAVVGLSDRPFLLDSDNQDYVIASPVASRTWPSDFFNFKLTVYQWGMGHKLVLTKHNKKLALERKSADDGKFPLILVANNDDYSEDYEDVFYLKINKKFDLNKTGVNPFFITAQVSSTSGKIQDVIINCNGPDSRFYGEIRPHPAETSQLYIVSVVQNNNEFANEGDGFMFFNKRERGWLDVHGGNGGKNWVGTVTMEKMYYGSAMIKTQWQRNGAPENFWTASCPAAHTTLKEIYEMKRYTPVRKHEWQLEIDQSKPMTKGIWMAVSYQSDNFSRIRKQRDSSGWLVQYKYSTDTGGVATISTQGTKSNDGDLWQAWRIRADTKATLKITQADYVG
eukprot:GHVN01040181.1.p1 GENE.GHVN01040181.1~~GHVN01040181.1.p1  ORF type:complete len:445 (-),score=77.91 GHVN01040181.1:380-1714(-)